jgi:hypothetical protein
VGEALLLMDLRMVVEVLVGGDLMVVVEGVQ